MLIFKPGDKLLRAAPRLYLCDSCKVEYGSCSLFQEYELSSYVLNPASLCSGILPPMEPPVEDFVEDIDDEEESSASNFIVENSVVAVAAPPKSIDTIWLVHVNETNCVSLEVNIDDYGNKIPPGITFSKGSFYECSCSTKEGTVFKLSKKNTFFYKESVVFPYVELQPSKKGYVLSNGVYADIICHIQETVCAHL